MKHHTCNEVDKSVIREKEPKKKKKTISAYDMKEGAFFFFKENFKICSKNKRKLIKMTCSQRKSFHC
jgi:hypothetical protein